MQSLSGSGEDGAGFGCAGAVRFLGDGWCLKGFLFGHAASVIRAWAYVGLWWLAEWKGVGFLAVREECHNAAIRGWYLHLAFAMSLWDDSSVAFSVFIVSIRHGGGACCR